MYISRVEIDRKNRQKMKDLNHLGAYHHWVESMFKEEVEKHIRSRKLWRIDQLRGKEYLMIVSEEKPDPENLEAYGVKGTGEVKDYDHFLSTLKNGQVVRFKAVLNPVISKSTGKLSGKRGRIMPHVTITQKMEYLKSKSERNGFKVEDEEFYITNSVYKIIKKSGLKPISVSQATYEGILTIEDVELFKNALRKGIGKNRAYGCGMITVIPEY